MTKKDLLEAIEDMPMDAEIEFYQFSYPRGYTKINRVVCWKSEDRIVLC